MYVMTPEFGAASQLEKIDMLDFAELVAINNLTAKAHKTLRDVRKQVLRNREVFNQTADDMPVFGTVAARFNDDVSALYHGLTDVLEAGVQGVKGGRLARPETRESTRASAIIPAARIRYLSRSPTRCVVGTPKRRAKHNSLAKPVSSALQPRCSVVRAATVQLLKLWQMPAMQSSAQSLALCWRHGQLSKRRTNRKN